MIFNQNQNSHSIRVDVHPNGQVRTTGARNPGGWLDFSGIAFPVRTCRRVTRSKRMAKTAYKPATRWAYRTAKRWRTRLVTKCHHRMTSARNHNQWSSYSKCVDCVAGTAQDKEAQTRCNRCKVGHVATKTKSEECVACKPGKQWQRHRTKFAVCNNCHVGTFQKEEAKTRCHTCVKGSVARTVGSDKCIECPGGKYYSAPKISRGASRRHICTRKRYRYTYRYVSGYGLQAYPWMSRGRRYGGGGYCGDNGRQLGCTNAKFGSAQTFSRKYARHRRYAFKSGKSNRYCSDKFGKVTCTAARVGNPEKFSLVYLGNSCLACKKGYRYGIRGGGRYRRWCFDWKGKLRCSSRRIYPSGRFRFHNKFGRRSVWRYRTRCVWKSIPGVRNADQARKKAMCLNCAAGKFQFASSLELARKQAKFSCLRCAKGTAAPNAGSARCLPCGKGSYYVNARKCEKCPIGEFSDALGSMKCNKCAVGSIAREAGTVKCTVCAKGTNYKIVSNDKPRWFETMGKLKTWRNAAKFCHKQGLQLCRRIEYCPEYPRSRKLAGGKTFKGNFWAPTSDHYNSWVQMGRGLHSSAACDRHDEMRSGHYADPSWGSSGSSRYNKFKKPLLCCPKLMEVARSHRHYRRPTWQSSTCCGGSAKRAVDGNLNSRWSGRSCTHTRNRGAWWQVDLRRVYHIKYVAVVLRSDCCGSRLQGAEVWVGSNSGIRVGKRCTKLNVNRRGKGILPSFQASKRDKKVWQACVGEGRYITIRISGRYLTLCEVQVYAKRINKNAKTLPVCETCVSGKYQDKTGQTSCLDCKPGRVGVGAAASRCAHCEGPSKASEGSPTGKFYKQDAKVRADGTRAASCHNCAKGKLTKGKEALSCMVDPAIAIAKAKARRAAEARRVAAAKAAKRRAAAAKRAAIRRAALAKRRAAQAKRRAAQAKRRAEYAKRRAAEMSKRRAAAKRRAAKRASARRAAAAKRAAARRAYAKKNRGKTCGRYARSTPCNLRLQSGWRNYSPRRYGSATVTKTGSLVTLSGLVKRRGRRNPILTLPRNARPSKRLIFNANNDANSVRVDVLTNGQVHVVTRYHSWVSLSGIKFTVRSGQRALSLRSGWRGYGGGYGRPTYSKVGRFCEVEGLLRGRLWGRRMAQLLRHCWPKKRLIFNLNNHAKSARVDVTRHGYITWVSGSRSHGWISLSGIGFHTPRGRTVRMASGFGAPGGIYGRTIDAHRTGKLCSVQGLIRGRRWGRPMAILPKWCRPKKRLIFSVNNNARAARVDVLPNGYVTWVAGGRTHGWVSATGIEFAVR